MRPIAFAALLPLAACSVSGHDSSDAGVPGSGTGTSRSYAVSGFTGVSSHGSDDVDVRVGTGFSVRAEGPAAELAKLRIVRDGDTLSVGRQSMGISWGEHDKVTVFVTMPRIVAAETAGSGDLKIDRVDGERFDGSIAGSGGLDVAALSARTVKLSIAGSGDISAKGSVGALSVAVAGSGSLDAPGLKASSADIAVQGSGDVAADVTGAATVSVMGSGDVALGKGAKCTTTKMGSGTVTCG